MNHKHNLMLILLAAVLLISFTTAFIFADGQHVTREQFFNSVMTALELKDADIASKVFPDANEVSGEYQGKINAGINAEYILGRNNGTLDPKAEITVRDIDYLLSRINFKPEKVVETKYVSGGIRYLPGETVIETVIEQVLACTEDEHVYQFDPATGCYACICGKYKQTVGTSRYYVTGNQDEIVFSADDIAAALSNPNPDYCQFDGENFMVMGAEFEDFQLPCDAYCYVLNSESQPERIDFIDLFNEYKLVEAKEATATEPATEGNENIWYEVAMKKNQNGDVVGILILGWIDISTLDE